VEKTFLTDTQYNNCEIWQEIIMKRLIQRGLMFGNLFHVSSPALVERYNRALKHLTGKTTKLTDFHIDISGFAPEIGEELNDPLYLTTQA
jgi:hypothetical protein